MGLILLCYAFCGQRGGISLKKRGQKWERKNADTKFAKMEPARREEHRAN